MPEVAVHLFFTIEIAIFYEPKTASMKYSTLLSMQHLLRRLHSVKKRSRQAALFFFWIISSFHIIQAQTTNSRMVTVKGFITSQTNEPLQGATVVVKGS